MHGTGRSATVALLVAGVVTTSCAGGENGRAVLEDLQGSDLACIEAPVVRDESAGCATAAGGLVASGHTDRAQAEETVALHLASGAEGRVVDGGTWTLLAESESLAGRVADHLDARVVERLEDATGGCPGEGVRRARLRDALEDPSWC